MRETGDERRETGGVSLFMGRETGDERCLSFLFSLFTHVTNSSFLISHDKFLISNSSFLISHDKFLIPNSSFLIHFPLSRLRIFIH